MNALELKIPPPLVALIMLGLAWWCRDVLPTAQAGGIVELAAHAQDNSKVHILINPTAAARQGIKFNAQLLRLATLLP